MGNDLGRDSLHALSSMVDKSGTGESMLERNSPVLQNLGLGLILRGIMSFLTKISDKILCMLPSKSESQAQL